MRDARTFTFLIFHSKMPQKDPNFRPLLQGNVGYLQTTGGLVFDHDSRTFCTTHFLYGISYFAPHGSTVY